MTPLRFAYLSRPFNRAGYLALKHLLDVSDVLPSCVLLPAHNNELGSKTRESEQIPHQTYNHYRFTKSIAELARDHRIPVEHTSDINSSESIERLRAYDPALIVVGGGWPQLLKPGLLAQAPLGAINAHPSLLPEFRGTDVHRWQVLHGVKTSGVTIHYLENTFDTGRILAQADFPVSAIDPPQVLAERAAAETGPLMLEVLRKLSGSSPGETIGQPQGKPVGHRYFSKWPWANLEFLRISWARTATELQRLVLASTQESYYYNGAYTFYRGVPFIIRQARVYSHRVSNRAAPGRILTITEEGPVIKCGRGALLLLEVQAANDAFWPEGFHKVPPITGTEFVELIKPGMNATLS